MPWNWQGRDSETSQSGSPAEARITKAWPDYEAEYLAKRLNNPKGKYDYIAGNDIGKLVYLDKISENYKEEADASLKAEFVAWLQGTHPDNVNPHTYTNGDAKPKRIHMINGKKNGKDTFVGQTRDDWTPTGWGQKQLTHLDGVREFLRSQAESEARSEYYMNLLAEYGPQDLESAWIYFKHWVKGRPVGNDVYLNAIPPDQIARVRDGTIRSPGFSMAPEDKPDTVTLARQDFYTQMGFPGEQLNAWTGTGGYNDAWVADTYENMSDPDARKDLYDEATRRAMLIYEQKNPGPRDLRSNKSSKQPKDNAQMPSTSTSAAPSASEATVSSATQPVRDLQPPSEDAVAMLSQVELLLDRTQDLQESISQPPAPDLRQNVNRVRDVRGVDSPVRSVATVFSTSTTRPQNSPSALGQLAANVVGVVESAIARVANNLSSPVRIHPRREVVDAAQARANAAIARAQPIQRGLGKGKAKPTSDLSTARI